MEMKEIHKILVPVDDSRASAHAFEKAIDMARIFGAEIHLITVENIEGLSSPNYTLQW